MYCTHSLEARRIMENTRTRLLCGSSLPHSLIL